MECLIQVGEENRKLVGKEYVAIQESKIDLEKLVEFVSDPAAGAIATFSGTTRDHYNGKKVLKLEYEAYIPMAEKEMKTICQEIRQKWDVLHLVVVHRTGLVPIGESSIVISISSIHRADALEGCQYCIDEIKARVPIWKKEFYEDGEIWKENLEWRKTHQCVSRKHQSSDTHYSHRSANHNQQHLHDHPPNAQQINDSNQ